MALCSSSALLQSTSGSLPRPYSPESRCRAIAMSLLCEICVLGLESVRCAHEDDVMEKERASAPS